MHVSVSSTLEADIQSLVKILKQSPTELSNYIVAESASGLKARMERLLTLSAKRKLTPQDQTIRGSLSNGITALAPLQQATVHVAARHMLALDKLEQSWTANTSK